MRIRNLVLTLVACVALEAVATNAAQAGQWTSGTTENQSTAGTKIAKETVKCAKHTGSELILHTVVLGLELTVTAKQVDCVEFSIDSTAGGVAHSEGKFTFTEVTLHPTNCMVPGDEITTKLLKDEVIMDPSLGSTVVFDKFAPVSGTALAEFEITGPECALAGLVVAVKGTACGEFVHTTGTSTFAPNPTGTLTRIQTLLFGASQQTTGGCKMTIGTQEATLTGAVDNELASAKPWGAD